MYALGHWESCQIMTSESTLMRQMQLCCLSHLAQVVYSLSFSYSVVKNTSGMNK